MIKKNILGLLFLLSALCLFNSCEDDPYYDDYGWATLKIQNTTQSTQATKSQTQS